jgi:AcrR family transcriptional regulator
MIAAVSPRQVDPVGALGVGGPRSEGTRRAILEAARATFAARGYEQTTIRAVAERAGIDASMVMRYFGSKAGLFTAASTVDVQAPDLRPVANRHRGEFLVRYFLDRWESSPSGDTLVLLMRTAVTNEAVAAQLQASFDRLIADPVAALGEADAGLKSAVIATQLLGLALCRYVLRLQPLASLPLDQVVGAVGPTIQRYLTQSPGAS